MKKAKTNDGFNILVDRLRPRRVSKEDVDLYLYFKEIVLFNIRRKYYQDQKRWREFSKNFFELEEKFKRFLS